MKFLAIGKMHGGCCDHGWGTRGNTRYEIFEADSMEEAKQKAVEYVEDEYGDTFSMFGDVISSDNDIWRGESLTIYAISDRFDFDVKALQAQDAIKVQAYYERQQQEADEKEFQRLKNKLKK